MGRRHCTSTRRPVAAVALAVATVLLLPALVVAHPLGNFTINHYAEVRVEPTRVLLDIVIDQAEIPAFQARQAFDIDGDGSVSDEETEVGRAVACTDLAGLIQVSVDGDAPLPLRTIEAGLSFPPGAGGLSTLRVVCGFEATLPDPLGSEPTRISFSDVSFPERIGWREIVARGSGVELSAVGGAIRSEGVSARLTVYPEELVAAPLRDGPLTVDAVAGGETLAPLEIPDAAPLMGAAPSTAPVPSAPTGAVPGGVSGGELPAIFRADLTPLVLLVSLITAAGLGAGHALTPGHGKTLMAAYLVGTRGTARHALALGLSVSLSHTVGILVLAALVVGASDVLPPDVVVRWAPVVAAISIVAIGAWMLLGELRRRRSAVATNHDQAHSGEDGHEHEHATDHGHDHDHDHEHAARHGHDHAQSGEHGHDHAQEGGPVSAAPSEHSHGGVRHSHLPAAGSAITWRSLFVLGLAGGLIPSVSALLILLGSIAAGRPAFGFVLVVAFGLGMAAVMGGIGLALVVARGRLDRLPAGGSVGRLRENAPLAAAVLVFGFGIYLTIQAVAGAPTL